MRERERGGEGDVYEMFRGGVVAMHIACSLASLSRMFGVFCATFAVLLAIENGVPAFCARDMIHVALSTWAFSALHPCGWERGGGGVHTRCISWEGKTGWVDEFCMFHRGRFGSVDMMLESGCSKRCDHVATN